VLPAAASAIERGEPAALVTIVRASGSTPQRTGAKMLVYADGRIVGTIGGGCYENDAVGKAREAIATGQPALVKYDLNDDFVQESGLICGGQMEVYIDPIAAAPALYVIEAGHIGWHPGIAASRLPNSIVDDREKFANLERFPDEKIEVDDLRPGSTASVAGDRIVVVVTRNHRTTSRPSARWPRATSATWA
jgi:xanthine dehydrogenase accessory factor